MRGRSPSRTRARERRGDALLFVRRHLGIERQDDAPILRRLRPPEATARVAPSVRRLAMTAHDAAPTRDAVVEEVLHHRALRAVIRQAHAEALPVAPRPVGLARQTESRDAGE